MEHSCREQRVYVKTTLIRIMILLINQGYKLNEFLSLYSFSVMGDMKSNKYFAVLYVGESI